MEERRPSLQDSTLTPSDEVPFTATGTISYHGDLNNATEYYSKNDIHMPDIVSAFSFVIMVLVSVLILLAHSILLLIRLKCEHLRSLTNVFILNLTVSDWTFILGLLCSFMLGYDMTLKSPVLRKAGVFCFCSGFFSSTLLLMMMSFHRYLLVLHPLSDPQSHDGHHGIAVSIITWTVSFSAAAPALGDDYDLTGIRVVIIFFLFLCVALFCFARIFLTQYRTSGERKDRAVGVILSMVVVSTLQWTPLFFINEHAGIVVKVVAVHIFLLFKCFKTILYVLLGNKFGTGLVT